MDARLRSAPRGARKKDPMQRDFPAMLPPETRDQRPKLQPAYPVGFQKSKDHFDWLSDNRRKLLAPAKIAFVLLQNRGKLSR